MGEVSTRLSLYNRLLSLKDKVDAVDATTVGLGTIETYIETVNSIWKRLDEVHTILIAASKDEDAIKVQNDAFEPMSDCYLEIKSKLYDIRNQKNSTPATRFTSNVKLPDISLPSFDGKYEDWPTFQDLFIGTIDNNRSLSGSQKLLYLKSCVHGDAGSLIKSFTVTDANYKEAWQLLESQYDNQREIIHSHVKKLIFQPSLKSESASSLQNMLTTTLESIRSLKVLGRPVDQWDDILAVLLIEKFDSDTKAEWARSLQGSDPVTFENVQDFIQSHIRTLHAKGSLKQKSSQPPHGNQSSQQARKFGTHSTSITSCHHCNEPHQLYQCKKLKDMEATQRYAAVRQTGVCLNCLKTGHMSRDCPSSACRKCNRKHNTFLHINHTHTAPTAHSNSNGRHSSGGSHNNNDDNHNSGNNGNASHNSGGNQNGNAVQALQSTSRGFHTQKIKTSFDSLQKLLKTALVDVKDSYGVKHPQRVFMDEGGEGGLIEEVVMHQRGFPKQRVDVIVTGVGEKFIARSKWKTFVRLFSKVNNSFVDVELYAIPNVTSHMKQVKISTSASWTHLRDLPLADPHFKDGGKIDILLGLDTVPYILKAGLRKLDRNSPVAQETTFGWVVFGNAGMASSFHIQSHKCDISSALKRFWEIEEVPNGSPVLTQEETECESHFMTTFTRNAQGKFIVRLPFNEKKSQLGESRDMAYRRFISLERRFQRQPEYKAAYVKFMAEYLELGHMVKVQDSTGKFYLPHHFVLKADSTTTKQRTVFDGSAKTTSGISLNDSLLVGATVQPDLYTLLLRFRYNSIALKADIAKMYRQFIIHQDDQAYQHILWREDSSKPVEEFALTTVTYGTASAPFLATRCLNQLAVEGKERYPLASQALLTSTYIDDYIGSSTSVEQAKETVLQLINITASAGMEIRKWCSNSKEVLQAIPEHLQEEGAVDVFDENDNSTAIKALGIKWLPSTDEFMFTVNVDENKSPTKRHLLSEIAKTFDPLGWLSPVTINAKLLLQKIWIAGNDWDTVISPELQREWKDYISSLLEVKHIRIPRCIITGPTRKIELHGFSDSSEAAYGCCIYVKCYYLDNSVSVKLLTSRSKVAPMKCVSLPKLELCGAKLLAETMDTVKQTFGKEADIYCYTDSTITLRWVQSHSRRWKTFVANRVSTIQTLVPPFHWHHVRSEQNPADLPSRGIASQQLLQSSLWWHGPEELKNGTLVTAATVANEDNEEVLKEERKIHVMKVTLSKEENKFFTAVSSLSKLIRYAAVWIKFIAYLRARTKKQVFIPKRSNCPVELSQARRMIIIWAQKQTFHKDYSELEKKQEVCVSSKLNQLSPYLDKHGTMRVGGRLQNSTAPEAVRHPIILGSHPLTQLIVQHFHLETLHGGFTITYSSIKREYWILRGRDTVRHFIRKCITCRKARATTITQLMGNLPRGRVCSSRPFLQCGVDYAGPFNTKVKAGRHVLLNKTYFAVFVCFATKAVHLEAVTSLTTDAFIACYERFVSRRGISAQLYSDCGTNFKGAARVLGEFLELEKSRLEAAFCSKGTKWIFNPPASPHQGGLWEAGVKAVKFHLKRIVGEQVLHLEQFQTLLCKIEAVLNSRPLCALSSDPNDMEPLTPGHFLIGEALTNIPEPDISNVKHNRLKYWEIIRQMTQHFWKRWQAEYLTSLQQRYKWTRKTANLEVGDMVVVADDQMPVAKWKMGRIISTHPGADGLVRTVTVKTAAGEFKRPIVKISPLITQNDI